MIFPGLRSQLRPHLRRRPGRGPRRRRRSGPQSLRSHSPDPPPGSGPRLRSAIGSGWRGTHVKVCSGSRCVRTVLGDWCQCYRGEDRERIIDLDDGVFSQLAPLSRGLQKVTVTW